MSAEPIDPLSAVQRELQRVADGRRTAHSPADRLRAHDRLVKDVWRFHGLLDAAPVAFVIVDERGEIVLVNTEAETMFGYGRHELIGRKVEILVPAAARKEHSRQRAGFMHESAGRQMGSGLELCARRKDGSEFPVEIGLGRLQTDDGVLISSAITDLTQRRAAHAAITRLAAIVESSNDAIVGLTLDGTIISCNPAAERIYGYAAAEALGRHASMVCPSSEHEHELESILARVAQGIPVGHLETTRRRKDGRLIDVSITVSPIRGRAGALAGASMIVRDITERRRAAETLAEAEERFRGAFEEAPIGMALLDLNGRLTKVNAAMCEITGYGPDKLEHKSLESVIDPDEGAELLDGLRAMVGRDQRLYAREQRLVHASGHVIWVALQVTTIRAGDGSPLRMLAQVQDITERKRYEDRLQDLADHDSLTGLHNRRSFGRELESQAARVNRYGSEGALLMLDLDHFKYVNDTLGHQGGDEVIIRVSEILAERLRESDVLARLGGDEFAILLPKATVPAAERLAADLLGALAESSLRAGGADARAITASIGIATFEPDLSGEDVMVNADLAMYDAKEAGRNQAALFRNAEHQPARQKGRVSWLGRINAALREERFGLLAQPIVDYATGRTSGHELLIRMIDDHGDMIPPAAFLYIAERLDIVQKIDAWVIRQAIGLLAGMREEALPLNVNLSARSIGDPALLELIEEELRHANVPPERLTFEITETAAVQHITRARRFGERLGELGCRLALDDFGSGFGSFYYLKHLPFDFLKIDGEFVMGCRESKTDRLVIEAVVGLARGLGKQTIAEYVGDDETVRLLTRLGVDHGQGFHHGRPTLVTQPSDLRPRAEDLCPAEPGGAAHVAELEY